jgi:hypothetical protein
MGEGKGSPGRVLRNAERAAFAASGSTRPLFASLQRLTEPAGGFGPCGYLGGAGPAFLLGLEFRKTPMYLEHEFEHVIKHDGHRIAVIEGRVIFHVNATKPFTAALAVVRVLPEIEPFFHGVGITIIGPQSFYRVWAGELRAYGGRFRDSGCRARFAAARGRL